jgi:hypothetical protein
VVFVSTIIRRGSPHDITRRRRAAFYRKHATELTEAAVRCRDIADQRHLIELAATYRRAANSLYPEEHLP